MLQVSRSATKISTTTTTKTEKLMSQTTSRVAKLQTICRNITLHSVNICTVSNASFALYLFIYLFISNHCSTDVCLSVLWFVSLFTLYSCSIVITRAVNNHLHRSLVLSLSTFFSFFVWIIYFLFSAAQQH